jgi:hypothetical protein
MAQMAVVMNTGKRQALEEQLLVRKTGMGLRRCAAGSVEELKELGRGQARLPQDRRQSAALHDAVQRDDGHAPLAVPVYRMTALSPHIAETD